MPAQTGPSDTLDFSAETMPKAARIAAPSVISDRFGSPLVMKVHKKQENRLSGQSRSWWFILVAIILAVAIMEAAAWLALALLDGQYKISYRPISTTQLSPRHEKALKRFIQEDIDHTGFSATLGWTIKPNTSAAQGAYVSNSARMRSAREYSLSPPVDKVRLATFGDSYTFGVEVRNDQTWQEQLVGLDDRFEILNFGVGGHGLDQAYLRYLHEGIPYSPDIVIAGFMTENINRAINVYRPYYLEQTGIPLTKPRFLLDGEGIRLIENPHRRLADYRQLLERPGSILPALGEHDFYYHARYAEHPIDFLRSVRLGKIVIYDLLINKTYTRKGHYSEGSEAYRLTLKLFEAFHRSALQNGSLPILLIYPHFSDVVDVKTQRAKKYQPLLTWLKTNGYLHLDIMDSIELFEASNPVNDFYTRTRGHYSPAGNRFVANQVLEWLRQNELTTRQSVAGHLSRISLP